MKQKRPYAEDINYWKTSSSAPDTWIYKAKNLIRDFGGQCLSEAYGRDADDRAAFMLQFQIGEDVFKIIWPVLPSRGNQDLAAKRQAATMLYHDIKAKCLSAKVLGARAAFFSYLMLPDGRNTSEASDAELMAGVPALLSRPSVPELADGIIEGEYLDREDHRK
jgi:hypothetical protein